VSSPERSARQWPSSASWGVLAVPRELAPGVHQLATDYPHTCGLPLWLHVVLDGDELVLLDSGTSRTTEAATEPELAVLGLALDDLSLVVNSHAHPDHMGGNEVLAARTGARFAAPAAEVARLEDNDLLLEQLWGASPEAYRLSDDDRSETLDLLGARVRIDHLLRNGDRVPTANGSLVVVETSGHSPGHIALLHEPSRSLFSFDDVQGRGVPFLDSDLWLGPLYEDVSRYRAGEHCVAVPPGDPAALAAAITQLLDDPARAERLGRAARAHVLERFAAERQAARLGGLLAERLGARVTAAPGTAAA